MWHGRDGLARRELRVGEDVLNGHYWCDRRMHLLERTDHLLRVEHPDPRTDRLVEFVLVLEPSGVAPKPRLRNQVSPSDQVQDTFGDRLRAGRHREPYTVACLISVARGRERRPVAGAALHDAELVVDRRLRSEDPEQRLDDGQVDHLSAALAIPPPQREHCRERTGEGGNAVTQGEGGQRRRAVGEAVHEGIARHGFGERAESRPVRVRAGRPKPVVRTMTSRGLSSCSVSQPKPQRSSVPVRKFST